MRKRKTSQSGQVYMKKLPAVKHHRGKSERKERTGEKKSQNDGGRQKWKELQLDEHKCTAEKKLNHLVETCPR